MKCFNFSPIGYFRSSVEKAHDLPRQPSSRFENTQGSIELLPHFQFEQALENLAGFSKIWVIFHFHNNTHWNPKILPPRGSIHKVGVFSSRSPYRPNPIGLSCVDLISIEKLKMHLGANDLLNDTPILDVKPYLAYCDSFPESRSGWLENIDQHKYLIEITDPCESQLQFLEKQGLHQLRGFIMNNLEYEPLNTKTKRLNLELTHPVLCYQTWRVEFKVYPEERKILLLTLFSGYHATDWTNNEDPYKDKSLHLAFIHCFGSFNHK